MSDRLSELIRQRALVLEHLAWMDGEIAAAKSKADLVAPAGVSDVRAPSGAPSQVLPTATALASDLLDPPVPASSAEPAPAGGAPVPETEVILEQYRVTPTAVKQDVRKGCLLYFVGAFVVLGIVVAILYFTIGTR